MFNHESHNAAQSAKAQPQPGRVKTISKSIDSLLEPVEIFEGLSRRLELKNSMLLESSEIESREGVKSILMLKAAIRIECNERTVKLEALTHNGANALQHIEEQLRSNSSELQIENTLSSKADLSALLVTYSHTQSFLDEDARLKEHSPIDILRLIKSAFEAETDNEYSIFLCGLFAFDFIASFENLPQVDKGQNTCPDYVFYLAENILIIDHQRNIKRLFSNHFSGDNEKNTYYELARNFETVEQQLADLNQPSAPKSDDSNKHTQKNSQSNSSIKTDIDDNEYQQIVMQLKQNIVKGDVFQVVPSRTFSIECLSPLASYRELKSANPSPYLFYMQDQDFALFGASPESALKYTSEDNKVLLYPIAGTRPRGKKQDGEIDLDLDARIEAELKLDEKELSEHMMLVDLARNDVARISQPGTTHVPRLLAVDRYSQVMHLVSCVQGQLREDLDALHAYRACMNMGTLTGAPKIKASQLIRHVEKKRRGSYGGAVGYLNGRGDMDTCIVIRSAFYQNGVAQVQAGAGIVYDSDPLMEAQETENKAKAVLSAVKVANQKVMENQ
ncbi:anthranilate synthase component 1 [Aliikangiella coralliicola]|uniref:Anthranilate synthase component 1 n=1 Tax=Aliikangiella coralliicola TaxID=2592383 RepID=A0A545TWE9_9GAMM|nr:anthranilate synthase component 1 [Aliikangiella coralliicola]TQV81546.1 anthranilate synthase component 1 [Aliikangiella coralliicola]